MCEAMRWNHLPVAGGLYDQHPQLLEEFNLIFAAKARKEERERKEQERKMEAKQRSGVGRRRAR